MGASSGLEKRQGASCELVFLYQGDLIFSEFALRLVQQIPVKRDSLVSITEQIEVGITAN